MSRVKIQITTPSNNVIKVSPGVSALSSVQLYLNELIDVNTQHGADGYVLTQQADGTFAMEAVATTLADLSDTNILNPQGGDSLVYDADAQKWVPGGVKSVNGQEGDVIISIPSPPPTPGVDGLADTNITNLQDDQIIRYDSASGNWLNEDLEALPAGGTTGQALVKASNTDYDVAWDDIAVDVQFHQRYTTEAETLRSGATETVELYFFAQGDGNGLAESASSDTPTSGYDIRRKLWYAEKAQADPDTSADWTQFTAIADNTTFANAKAALLAYLKDRTGGTVPISLKMTWEEVAQAPAFTGLLNETYGSGAEAAYSTRRLNGNYSGDCMTIRRASDGTTQGIGFVGEEIDESAIETFCSGTTCTVATWFDQSGNGNNATQTTPANQPTIYTGGQLVKEGGRLALDFDGTNDSLNATAYDQPILTSIIVTINDATDLNHRAGIIKGSSSSSKATMGHASDLTLRYDGAFSAGSQTAATNTQYLRFAVRTTSTQTEHVNGAGNVNTSLTLPNASGNINLGASANYAAFFDGRIQEAIIYNSDKSTDRTDIEGNISAYFQSAKLLDESFGSGAEAAYSTRQLRRDQTECMVIRRASDSTTTTIGFDGSGNIDEAAIETFCTGTTCTVYQWLDQSGNGNTATAAAPANEPTIYTGGAIYKVNGRAAVKGGGTNVKLDFTSTVNHTGNFSHYFVNTVQFPKMPYGGPAGNYYYQISATQLRFQTDGTTEVFSGYNFDQGQRILTSANRGLTANNLQVSVDGYDNATTQASTDNFDVSMLFAGNGGGFWYTDYIQEFIAYDSSKSAANQNSIESNIGDYYTQNTPLLDTYSGAAAAYSLRLLDSSYVGSAVEVYNGSSYADIGFNVFGELDTVALAAHCGSNDGFVSKWYDQSGSNHATQTTTANMPKIYDGTTGVVTENGKPAVEFDGVSDRMTSAMSVTSDFTTSVVLKALTASQANNWILQDTSGVDIILRHLNTNFSWYDGTGHDIGTAGTNQHHIFVTANSSGSVVSFDGADQSISGISNNGYTDLEIGGDNGSRWWHGRFQEIVIYGSYEATNRTNIEDNINTFYSIY